MNRFSSEHSGDEHIASLRQQARCALEKFHRQRSQVDQSSQKPPQLKYRHVRIPQWTVDAVRKFQGEHGDDDDAVVGKTTGGHMAAAVLSQLLYWLMGTRKDGRPRAHEAYHNRGLDHPWIATTFAELAGQIGATRKQVERCMAALRANGWIGYHPMRYKDRGRLRGLTVSHIWLGQNSLDMVAKISKTQGTPPAMWLSLWAMLGTGGDINAALVLSRLVHLARRHKQALAEAGDSHDNEMFHVTNEDLGDRLMLSPDQIKRAKKQLRDRGLIEMPGRSLVLLNKEFCYGLAVLSADRLAGHSRGDVMSHSP